MNAISLNTNPGQPIQAQWWSVKHHNRTLYWTHAFVPVSPNRAARAILGLALVPAGATVRRIEVVPELRIAGKFRVKGTTFRYFMEASL
jgi:hypothetical protein